MSLVPFPPSVFHFWWLKFHLCPYNYLYLLFSADSVIWSSSNFSSSGISKLSDSYFWMLLSCFKLELLRLPTWTNMNQYKKIYLFFWLVRGKGYKWENFWKEMPQNSFFSFPFYSSFKEKKGFCVRLFFLFSSSMKWSIIFLFVMLKLFRHLNLFLKVYFNVVWNDLHHLQKATKQNSLADGKWQPKLKNSCH